MKLFERDKALHFIGGGLLFLLGLLLVSMCTPYTGVPRTFAALLLPRAAGVAKELYDATRPDIHTVDAWDEQATFSGAVLLAFICVLLGV